MKMEDIHKIHDLKYWEALCLGIYRYRISETETFEIVLSRNRNVTSERELYGSQSFLYLITTDTNGFVRNWFPDRDTAYDTVYNNAHKVAEYVFKNQ